jgi:hypothetical protein
MTFDSDVEWNGGRLSVWVTIDAGRILCQASRDAIHCLAIYNDAVTWEIERYKSDILERLKPAFVAKIAAGNLVDDGPIRVARLNPGDV